MHLVEGVPGCTRGVKFLGSRMHLVKGVSGY